MSFSCPPTHVVAIDFGTSNTAVAYAKTPTTNSNNTNPHIDIILFQLDKNKPKTKTIVALDINKPKGQQCIAFGDLVRKKFEDEDSFHSNVLIFEHFHNIVSNGNDLCIAHNGKTKPIKQVIGETLKYIMDRLIENMKIEQKKDIPLPDYFLSAKRKLVYRK